MERRFTIAELCDMHLIYGEAKGVARAAVRIYRERFPRRRLPARKTFAAVHQRLRDTGSLLPRAEGRGPQRADRTLEAEERILDRIQKDPSQSTRSIAHHVCISHTVIHCTLQEERLQPYHNQRVQALEEQDFPPRCEFSEWFLLHSAQHDFCQQNTRHIVATHFQRRFSVNVWAGMLNNYIIGPYVSPARLTGNYYRKFLEEKLLPMLLEDIPLGIRYNMWFLHYGAPPHNGHRVHRFLDS
ncbi:uncharacterized protein LOC126195317 [Schistocerca nitens]|uniref:uncharacterized protein LOC126195317 n=1 Tax=Schistocerca nitens TaxID=7011 RepID=UPI0021184B8B|nr:uncharacterized protein LOC126195317 [Schistocerca nitens]